jgi:glycosyltransferase involved in cell wall biosynthesis
VADRARPVASVVIPAHDEEAVIGRLLTPLAPAAVAGELLVVVACNGCTDRTAVVAAGFSGVMVVTIGDASKVAALNAGDAAAGDVFPRLYIDADVRVDLEAVRAVAEALDTDLPRAAAPRMRAIVAGRPAVVRGFYRVFMELPWVTDNLVGSGFYGVSRAGRARFGAFPDLINDDLVVRELFRSDERICVAAHEFAIETPRTTSALVRAKARVSRGVGEYAELAEAARRGRGEPARRPRGGSLPFVRLGLDPRNWPALAAYGLVRGGARLRRATSAAGAWGQDRTTRSPA